MCWFSDRVMVSWLLNVLIMMVCLFCMWLVFWCGCLCSVVSMCIVDFCRFLMLAGLVIVVSLLSSVLVVSGSFNVLFGFLMFISIMCFSLLLCRCIVVNVRWVL